MSLINPFRDGAGRLRAGAAPGAAVVGDFFETEVGENQFVLKELLAGLEGVSLRREQEVLVHGNIYTVTVSPTCVRIGNLHDERAPGYELAPEEFRVLIALWHSHCG